MAAFTSTRFARGPGQRRGETRRPGQWKLAYADFLTALVALFLVLWLSGGASQEDRAAIAAYFKGSPPATSREKAPPAPPSDFLRLADDLSLQSGMAANFVPMLDGDALVINLVDRTGAPVFEMGAAAFTERGAELAATLGARLAPLEAAIAIKGHTDPFPSAQPGYSNWNLSTDRAETALSSLLASGVSLDRIDSVSGVAATEPLYPREPHRAANRRVSIVLKQVAD
ncbi:MAG: flagellar motor protein MotB [Pseudomonadota bacterium]